jgi:hypothetical protein
MLQLNYRRIPVLQIVLATVCLGAPVRADEPAAKPPSVPPLIVGAEPPAPQSFVADGVVRSSAEKGLGFHVASQPNREVCALYDATDGTPMLFSDGHQTLIYDLAENRILRVPTCRGSVRVDWDANSAKPMNFSFNFELKSDPKKLADANAWFRIDRFIEASADRLKRVDAPAGGGEIWAAERHEGTIDSVQLDPADPTWFNFRSLLKATEYYSLELHATHIGRPLPAAALAFPDLTKLAKEIHVENFNLKVKPALIDAFASGRCFAPKLALAGENDRAALKKVLPNVDIDLLRAADLRFSARYRAALAKQEINFPTLKSAGASTQRAAASQPPERVR